MAARQILGALRSTPIEILDKEAGLMPLDLRLEQTSHFRVMRWYQSTARTNPLRKSIIAEAAKSPVEMAKNKLTELLKRLEPDTNEEAPAWINMEEWTEGRAKVHKLMIQSWQEKFDQGTKGKWYREHNGDKCTTKLKSLPLSNLLANAPRSILSRVFQLSSGVARTNRQLKLYGKVQSSVCDECEVEDTIEHVIYRCQMYQEPREQYKVNDYTPRDLFSSPRGLDMLSKFVKHLKW